MDSKKLLACILLTACFAAVQSDRELKVEGPGTWFQCSTLSALRIRVFAGKCTGSAHANCLAVAESLSATTAKFDIFSSLDTLCDAGGVKVFAVAIGKAIARVWASAGVRVRCDGVGWGCGWAFANGRAWAAAFARAIAQAMAEVVTPKADAFCVADIEALSLVFAQAAAKAKADACAKGGQGTVSDFESAFAQSISTAIAKATAVAFAKACSVAGKDIGAAASQSKCFGSGESTGTNENEEESTGGGETSTGGGQIVPCGASAGPCCGADYRSRFCTACAGCGNGDYWIKTRESGPDKTRIWNKRNGKMCNCGGEKQG